MACAASVWKNTFFALQSLPIKIIKLEYSLLYKLLLTKLPISLIGCFTPISLFTAMMDTSAVSERIVDSNSSREIMPVE